MTVDTDMLAAQDLAEEPTATEVVHQLEEADALDNLARAVSQRLPDWIVSGRGREILSGQWLGHALHPALTDLPIGCWTGATLLDLLGGKRSAAAARRLVALGILSSLPTAASGLSDWSRLGNRDRRVGVVHAQLNGLALGIYCASYAARRRNRAKGIMLGLLGGLVLTAGSYLGGHLTLVRSVTRENELQDTYVPPTA